MVKFVLLCILLGFSLTRGALGEQPDESRRYIIGGSGERTLPADLEREIQQNIDLIRLGINLDWIAKAGLHPDLIVKAHLELARAAKMDEVPGAVLHVDSLLGENMPVGVGYRITDPEKHPAEWSTFYELGQLTGVVAVTPLALSAIERGKLSLKQTVGEWIPELNESDLSGITIEMLMRHTSGLPEQLTVPPSVRTREELLALVASTPIVDKPGKSMRAGDLNFMLLGLILEKQSGLPVQELAERELFLPLGMTNTTFDLPDHLRDQCAAGPYSRWHGRMAWAEAADPAAYILGTSAGHGGLISNPDDLAIFSRAMLMGYMGGLADFVTTDTLQSSVTPSMKFPGGGTQGLGWALGALGKGSFGWNAPNGCSLWLNPRTQNFVVLLSNANHPASGSVSFAPVHDEVLRLIENALPVQKEEVHLRRNDGGLRSKGMGFAVRNGADRCDSFFADADLNCHEAAYMGLKGMSSVTGRQNRPATCVKVRRSVSQCALSGAS